MKRSNGRNLALFLWRIVRGRVKKKSNFSVLSSRSPTEFGGDRCLHSFFPLCTGALIPLFDIKQHEKKNGTFNASACTGTREKEKKNTIPKPVTSVALFSSVFY